MSDEEMLNEAAEIVFDYFGEEYWKAVIWWSTNNPALGGIEPIHMYEMGRMKKLLKLVKALRDGY